MASLMMLKVFIYDKSLFHTLRVALLSRLNLDWSTSPPLPLLSRLKPLQEWPNSLSHQCIWTIAARLIFIMTLKGWMVALYCLQNKSEPLPGSSPRANFPCFCCSVPLHEFFLLPNWHTHFPHTYFLILLILLLWQHVLSSVSLIHFWSIYWNPIHPREAISNPTTSANAQ